MTAARVLPARSLGEGRAVVLLHAFPLDGRMWMDQAEALANECRVVVPDLRGFGTAYGQLESMPEIPIDLAADDVAALLGSLGIKRAVIGGISRGGYVALAFARRHPQMLDGLILCDTRAAAADEKEKQSWREMIHKLQREGMTPIPDLMKSRLLGATALADRPELLEQVTRIILSQRPDAVAAAANGMANRPDARAGLAQIRTPVLAIAGEEDTAFESTRAIATQIPGAQFVAIANTGHLVNLEQPVMVRDAIRGFLAGLKE